MSSKRKRTTEGKFLPAKEEPLFYRKDVTTVLRQIDAIVDASKTRTQLIAQQIKDSNWKDLMKSVDKIASGEIDDLNSAVYADQDMSDFASNIMYLHSTWTMEVLNREILDSVKTKLLKKEKMAVTQPPEEENDEQEEE